MNNKGFTLVELLGIIVILAAILLVSFPTILNSTKDNKEKQYKSMVDDLCLAGKTYIYNNMDVYSDKISNNNEIDISISELINNEYVDKNIKNPRTNNLVNSDSLKYTISSDNSLNCQYIEN